MTSPCNYLLGLMQNSVITMYHVAAICGLAVCSIDACLLCVNRAMTTSLFNVHYVSRHFKRGVIYRRFLNVAMIGMTPIDYLVITSSVLNRFSKFRRHMKGRVTRYAPIAHLRIYTDSDHAKCTW